MEAPFEIIGNKSLLFGTLDSNFPNVEQNHFKKIYRAKTQRGSIVISTPSAKLRVNSGRNLSQIPRIRSG
jgi:hypothetical protein